MTQDNNNNKVLIIGAGLAGLTLANALKCQGVPFEVYERDTHVTSRTQGWSLSLHMALDALKQYMPKESFANFSKEVCVVPGAESSDFKFIDANTGDTFMQIKNDKGGSYYRVDRRKLREWLLKPIEEHVNWNKKILRYEENEDSVTAFFEDGTQATGDLLVGTDGAHSPVACQLLGGKESFQQLTNVLPIRIFGVTRTITRELWDSITADPQFICIQLATMEEDDSDAVQGNSFIMFSSVQSYNVNKSNDDVDVLWILSRYDGEGVIPMYDNSIESEREKCMAVLKSWARRGLPEESPYRKLILDTPQDAKVTPIFIRERIPTAELLQAPKRRVILVGDAAHPMSMYKGEGGNHAIIDASNLGAEIRHYKSGSKTLDEAIKSYYKEMIPRGKKAVEESRAAAMAMHTKPSQVLKKIYAGISADIERRIQQQQQR